MFRSQQDKCIQFAVLSEKNWLIIFPSEYVVNYQLHAYVCLCLCVFIIFYA